MEDVYDKSYDYGDMKIAMCVADFFNTFHKDDIYDYEDLVRIAIEIRNAWENEEREDLSEEEYAYVQSYAIRYLKENYLNLWRE